MDDLHRKKILENMSALVEGISSFDQLFDQLKSKGMFNSYMEHEILSIEETRKLNFLYWYVTTRGPDAFNQLCQALREINHNDLADLLTNYRPSRVFRVPIQNGDLSNELDLEEEYPCDEEWTVIKGVPGVDEYDFDVNKVYKMRSSPRGLALVINNRNFINETMEKRVGSEKDVARLESILSQMGYQVMVAEDLTVDGMMEELYDFSKNDKHWQCDSAILVVMSHGKQTTDNSSSVLIAGVDTRLVHSQELVRYLSAKKCEALRGKPVIIFFQACRGDNYNYSVTLENNTEIEEDMNGVDVGTANGVAIGRTNGVANSVASETVNAVANGEQEGQSNNSLQTDGVRMGQTNMVRSDSDIFIAHATSPGMLSMRDPVNGSWYIQTLCRVFAKHAWHDDLHSMLQTVKQERDRLGYTTHELDIEETNQGFNKLLYFQPGIFGSSLNKHLNGS